MERQESFEEFEPYKLDDVKVTDRELGRGSYAAVVELEYRELKCAGKKIYQAISNQGVSYALRRFAEECRLLCQMRHPNVVQFLGVYFERQAPASVPILVMEFLSTNLSSCIDQYRILPKEISYSILHDVSLGFNYLHCQTPLTIHRDLSANNVLLTSNMTAKISDLGVARILNLTPLQMSHMTETPGTPTYMPPEVMVADPKYDTSVDVFSYGIMMIHVFSGKWPHPKVGQVRVGSDGQLIPVSETARRIEYLRDIGRNHPLMELILRCISNDPKQRSNSSEIVQRMSDSVQQHPPSFANKVEMLSRIQALAEEKRDLVANIEQMNSEVEQEHEQVTQMEKEIVNLKEQHQVTVERLNLAHTTEKECVELAHITEIERLELANEIKVEHLQSEVKIMNAQIEMITRSKQVEIETLNKTIEDQSKVITELQLQLELNSEKTKAVDALSSKENELTTALVELHKDNTIKCLNEQLTRTTEYLSSKRQLMQSKITWKQCTDFPIAAGNGQASIISKEVYCGGFDSYEDGDRCTVYSYDRLNDTWSALPPLPVLWFGLGQVRGQLVAVGGELMVNGDKSNEVYMHDFANSQENGSLPAMPGAISSPSVISHPTALVIAGGDKGMGDYVDSVVIFNTETLKWYWSDPLPTPCCDMSSVVIGDSCYLVGGCKHPARLNQVLCASILQLLRNAKPLIQEPHCDTVDTQNHVSAWKKLANTPTYQPTAGVIAETLFSFGGKDEFEYGKGEVQSAVYMYSPPTDSWFYVTDLPAPRYGALTAVLSPTEILVVGGWDDEDRQNTVYKGTLKLL